MKVVEVMTDLYTELDMVTCSRYLKLFKIFLGMLQNYEVRYHDIIMKL